MSLGLCAGASGQSIEAGYELADCGEPEAPWVSVRFSGATWTPEFLAEVLADLRASLKRQGLHICREPFTQGTAQDRASPVETPPPVQGAASAQNLPPLARIELRASSKAHVSVVLDVDDRVTAKRSIRALDLSEVPEDGRALALAVSADELLRASWAELMLNDASAAIPPPPEVEQALAQSAKRPISTDPSLRIGIRAVGEHHGGGQTLLGADALRGMVLVSRFGVELWLGARHGLSTDSEHGRILARGVGGGVDLTLGLLPPNRPMDLMAAVGLAGTHLRFDGDAADHAVGRSGAALDVHARTTLAMELRLWSPVALRCELSAGLPMRSVGASDAGKRVTSTDGLQLRAAVGLGVRL